MFLRFAPLIGAALICASILGCNKSLTQDIQTVAEANPQVRFSGMHTYGWFGAAVVINDPEELWTAGGIDAGAELKHLIDTEMRKRGWNEAQNPDMLIGFLVVNDVTELKVIESERAGGVPDLVGVGKGSLLVEIMDAHTKQTIWLGAATANSQSGRSAETTKKRFKYGIRRLFNQIPR